MDEHPMRDTFLEIRGFGKLRQLFTDRQWPFPYRHQINCPVTGCELLQELGIPIDQVEVVMVNGHVQMVDKLIQPGDRVALVPPGTPGPYRVLLGFVDRNQPPSDREG